jgi:hypothetical protein
MREITTHKVNGLNEALKIDVLDQPGAGGANHIYRIRMGAKPAADGSDYYSDEQTIQFQNGPIAEAGVNGISQEALLAIIQDRLECFQAGQYSCPENAEALSHVRLALHWLQKRTIERTARGVEGTSKL